VTATDVCVWHLCEKPMNEYLCASKPRGIFSPIPEF
jgi:hypothetical protein